MSSSEVDHSIDLTLGNFSDAAPLFGTDTKQFIGITTYPTTPIATSRQMPPLAYPQPKQSSSTFNSNGITASAQSSVNNNSSSRPYNNSINNNNTIINNNNTAINNVNNYQQKSSSLTLLPPPQSRANSSNSINNNVSITSTNNNNTFARPLDSKPLINGRSGYTTGPQLNKHEVIINLLSR